MGRPAEPRDPREVTCARCGAKPGRPCLYAPNPFWGSRPQGKYHSERRRLAAKKERAR